MTSHDDPDAKANAIFAAWRARFEAGEDRHIEELCREHPDCGSQLLHLHADWMLARSAPMSTRPPGASLSAQLRALFGHGVDPGICLDPAIARDAISERLDSLKRRDASSARYDVREKVGQGGMGAVYRVFDQDLRRHLAMKVALDGDPSCVARFLEEAQVNGQLDHPGIVPVHEVGIDEKGRVFFTMKLVRGSTLDEIFDKANTGADGWNVTRAVSLLLRICEAMAFAHEKGVIHRDLKPGNVMVGRFGEVYVMDWGLARVLSRNPDGERASILPKDDESIIETDRRGSKDRAKHDPLLTRDGDVVGTPAYMAPEQATGRLDAMGPQADVYAVGAMLYRLLAGRSPYSDELALAPGGAVLRRILVGPPTPIATLAPNAPEELRAICAKAMRTDLGERYASMEILASDLRAYLENRVVAAHESGAVAEFRKWVRRNRGLAIAASLAVMATIGGLASVGVMERQRRSEVEIKNAEIVARERETAARKAEFDQLAGIVLLEEAIERESDLYPAHPEKIPAIEQWLAEDAGRIARLRPLLESTLASLSSRDSATPATEAERFLERSLGKLNADIAEFERSVRPRVEERLGWAKRIEALTLSHPNARVSWAQAREAIAKADGIVASAAYATIPIDLLPQMGLVPIGTNPATKLWEFLDLRSACDVAAGQDPATIEIPSHREDGAIAVGPETGIVFVLIPGGRFLQGAQEQDPNRPNYDSNATLDESPNGEVFEVSLEPFFLARHETTQGQWLRLTGVNPSLWAVQYPTATGLDRPVEGVTWSTGDRTAFEQGLELPTEARWEYAARAGTSTPWYFGDDSDDMESHGNVRDRSMLKQMANVDPRSCESIDDGHGLPARVGSYLPNPFGLYDVYGNVHEWCKDRFGPYTASPRSGDGERDHPNSARRIFRGGSWSARTAIARSSSRRHDSEAAGEGAGTIGVRFARSLRR